MSQLQDESARQTLITFVDQVHDDIAQATYLIDLLVSDKRIKKRIKDSWDVMGTHFESVRKWLDEVDMKELGERGLTGRELRLKIAVYRKHRNLFKKWVRSLPSQDSGATLERWSLSIQSNGFQSLKSFYRKAIVGKKRFVKTAKVAIRILESLGIPGADAISEAEDMISIMAERDVA